MSSEAGCLRPNQKHCERNERVRKWIDRLGKDCVPCSVCECVSVLMDEKLTELKVGVFHYKVRVVGLHSIAIKWWCWDVQHPGNDRRERSSHLYYYLEATSIAYFSCDLDICKSFINEITNWMNRNLKKKKKHLSFFMFIWFFFFKSLVKIIP